MSWNKNSCLRNTTRWNVDSKVVFCLWGSFVVLLFQSWFNQYLLLFLLSGYYIKIWWIIQKRLNQEFMSHMKEAATNLIQPFSQSGERRERERNERRKRIIVFSGKKDWIKIRNALRFFWKLIFTPFIWVNGIMAVFLLLIFPKWLDGNGGGELGFDLRIG